MVQKMNSKVHSHMELALAQARASKCDIPVGCVIVRDDKVLAQAANMVERNCDSTGHAEILAIREAGKSLGNWRLDNCELYVTLEPCEMCSWAIIKSRIARVYFGAYDTGYSDNVLSSKIETHGGILEKQCSALLNDYFQGLRNK